MTQGDYRGALEQFSYASDLDPQNGNYRAELAYCRYLYNPQDGGSAALAELKTALRIDPDSGLVHYYAGLILSSMDLIEEAKRALRRAIKPMAPDRRPVEALKKL
jgi:tetratricopeptide (TPR) repeat protein